MLDTFLDHKDVLWGFLVALGVVLALTPAVGSLARILGAVDEPGAERRRIHRRAVPTLGGLAIFLGIVIPGHEQTALSFDPQAPLVENLTRFGAYTLISSTGSFDTGRAITNAIAIVLVGPAVLTTLRRAARRATVVGTVSRPPVGVE